MKFITRVEWKAKLPTVPYHHHIPRKITIHHQGFPEDYPTIHQIPCFEGHKTVRKLQKLHQDKTMGRGLIDIAWHAIIAPNGDIYECRPFSVEGQHVKNNNNGNIGIMIVGNFNVEKPTKEQVYSLRQLIIKLSVDFSSINIPKCINGHKAFTFTECPGANLHSLILDWKYEKLSIFEFGE